MPFNFCNCKYYSINYSSLFNELNSKKILSDKNLQTEFLKLWMRYLKNADDKVSNELRTQESISKLKLLLQSEPEIFQIPMYHQSNEVFIHFRVSKINELISKNQISGGFIPLSEFIKKDSRIKWAPIESDIFSNLNSKKPIIIVPFLSGQYSSLVIDGNHRLTSKTKHNINDVNGLLIPEETLIKQSLLTSGFDELYYIMNNELCRMFEETYSEIADPMEIVQKSYLNGGSKVINKN
ncbi:TPA: hypothetical protein N2D99_002113 [Clostridium botulinum]|nr:hypothetical protein [Clostridium botulinum]